MLHLLTTLSFAMDHSPWDALLKAHVDNSGVDYASFDGAALDAYVAALGAAPKPEGKDETLAFYINAYNALTVDLILANPGVASIRDLDEGEVWKTRSFNVAGESVTLDHIEHGILRPLGSERVHASVNCASKGCPPLLAEAFVPERVDAQMTSATRNWVSLNAYITSKRMDELHLSQIFDWFGDDFSEYADDFDIPGVDDPKQEAALNFLRAYTDPGTKKWIESGTYSVHWWDYDWALNKK